MSIDFNTQIRLEQSLAEMKPSEQVEWFRHFLINMMDWTEQTDMGDLYHEMYRKLKSLSEDMAWREARRQEASRKTYTSSRTPMKGDRS